MKIYTKLFLDEITQRIDFLITLYKNDYNNLCIDEYKISDFNINILVKKNYIKLVKDTNTTIAILTEEGLNFIKRYITDLESVS